MFDFSELSRGVKACQHLVSFSSDDDKSIAASIDIPREFRGAPWNQISTWKESDTKCDRFEPKQFQKHICTSCSRFMHQHRRTAVRDAAHVLAGIDAGGGATEILAPDEIFGGLYLSGQRAVNETLFREKRIEMCVTVAKDLDRNGFKGFKRRRERAARSTNAEILELEWKDTTSQKIEWKDLEHAIEFIDRGRREGRNVLVSVCFFFQSLSLSLECSIPSCSCMFPRVQHLLIETL